uniref:Alpha-ketoglutarate-dependent dioxygenase AlkB-like domain-containing protein n=1 Tax=Brassica campestris TaxID=3711 RepID=A0A3P5Y8H0_BRACM|nr:unnamed protein product [Brassica rapa]
MAMPPGNWIPDGRDGFISWIRGEFAAANAIIDSLCQHLVAVGDQNEYESVVSAIQHRQASWSQVLYMQQFYSIADISHSLHQAALKRRQQGRPQQRHYYSSDQFGGRRSGPGFNKHHHGGGGGGYRGGGAESMVRNKSEIKVASDDKALSVAEEKIDNNLSSKKKQEEKDKECPASMAKTFVVEEMYEAKLVNVVEGLKLYEKMVDVSEVSQLVSLANNLRNAGRRGQLQSEAYVSYKRPNRGHGREMIQLGLPIADTMPDDDESAKVKGKFYRRIEPIPSFISDIIERLVSKQIIPVKPDACIIDFFNEGDHSQPHMFVPWFGRPVGILSLSECEFTFGRVIVSDYPGDYMGSLKLSLTPGSLLLVEGNSADLAKFAIHSIPKKRILITFTKSQPRNSIGGTNWSPPPSRSPQNHHNSVQPIFKVPSPPLASPMPFPGGVLPVGTSWPLPPPQPRVPVPGTGVFLPPGSAQEQVVLGSTEKSNDSNGNNCAEGKI